MSSGSTIRVVVVDDHQIVREGLTALLGALDGIETKGSGAEEVEGAIRAAAAGGMVFGSSLAGRVADDFAGTTARSTPAPEPFPDLTERERAVLERLAAGKSNDAIASELYVSDKAVRNAVSAIYAKLHAAGRAEAAIIKAREAGYGR